eukprot:6839177-Prorocentrum_lima.AAC.1
MTSSLVGSEMCIRDSQLPNEDQRKHRGSEVTWVVVYTHNLGPARLHTFWGLTTKKNKEACHTWVGTSTSQST